MCLTYYKKDFTRLTLRKACFQALDHLPLPKKACRTRLSSMSQYFAQMFNILWRRYNFRGPRLQACLTWWQWCISSKTRCLSSLSRSSFHYCFMAISLIGRRNSGGRQSQQLVNCAEKNGLSCAMFFSTLPSLLVNIRPRDRLTSSSTRGQFWRSNANIVQKLLGIVVLGLFFQYCSKQLGGSMGEEKTRSSGIGKR